MPLIIKAEEKGWWKHGLPKCLHLNSKIVAVVSKSGAQGRREQCDDCGQTASTEATVATHRDAPPCDEGKRGERDTALDRAKAASGQWGRQQHAMRAEAKPYEDAEWWAKYASYLRSPEWAACRRRVLERDNWRCTAGLPGCNGKGEQVHHREGGFSYAYLDKIGQTPLFLLASVCIPCHCLLTTADRRISGRTSRPPE